MVSSATAYARPQLVTRKGASERNRGWASAGVELESMLARVKEIDPYFGVQLQVMQALGLRSK